MNYICPVCGYPKLEEPAYDEYNCSSFEICPSCGTEFGYDDATTSHQELRQRWLSAGAPWYSHATAEPPQWDAVSQLRKASIVIVEEASVLTGERREAQAPDAE